MEANNGIHNEISEFCYAHYTSISTFHAYFYWRNSYFSELARRAFPRMMKELEAGYSSFVLFLMNLTIFLMLNCPTTRVTFAAKSVRRPWA
jgi:hypothetical protein